MNTAFDRVSNLFRQLPGEFSLRSDLNRCRIHWVFQGGTPFRHTGEPGIIAEDAGLPMSENVQRLEKTGAASVTAHGGGGDESQTVADPADAARTEAECHRVVVRKHCENQAKGSVEKKSRGQRGPKVGF